MNTQTQPKNWNDLPDLMETHELSAHDEKCLAELQLVIEKHNLTSKFGVSLLHKHFEIADDEVLLEKNDPITRELISQPVKVEEDMNQSFAVTQWRFDDGYRYGCSYCKKDHCT